MNPKTSHKIIAAIGIAAAIGVGIFVLKTPSHPASSGVETAAPSPTVAQTSAAVPDVPASIPAAPVAVAPVAGVTATVTRTESVEPTNSVTSTAKALMPPPARSRAVAAAGRDARASGAAVTASRSAAGNNGESARETVADRAERLTGADVQATRLSSGTLPVGDRMAGMTPGLAPSDSQITTDVKTAIAGDLAVKDLNIGVSTTDGVVALTGSLGSQGAIDQVKAVAGKVKDVKSVDTSGLIVAIL